MSVAEDARPSLARLRDAGRAGGLLTLVTDRRRLSAESLVGIVGSAAEGGLPIVQLREKDLQTDDLWRLARSLRAVTTGRTLLFINDRADIALAVGADGVHLPTAGLPVAETRRIVGPEVIIGRAVHSVAEAIEAERDGADYVQLGTIFATDSKPGVAPAGLDLVRAVTGVVRIPVIAIGGITPENAWQVVDAGAAGVAVISAILGAANPRQATRNLCKALRRAGGGRPGVLAEETT